MRQRKRLFDLAVLAIVSRLQPNAYGVPVWKALEAFLEGPVSLARIYDAFERLEAQGLVTSWMGNPTAERGWREKRYFTVTTGGAQVLRPTDTTERRQPGRKERH